MSDGFDWDSRLVVGCAVSGNGLKYSAEEFYQAIKARLMADLIVEISAGNAPIFGQLIEFEEKLFNER